MLYYRPGETGIALILLGFGGILPQPQIGIVFDSRPDRAEIVDSYLSYD